MSSEGSAHLWWRIGAARPSSRSSDQVRSSYDQLIRGASNLRSAHIWQARNGIWQARNPQMLVSRLAGASAPVVEGQSQAWSASVGMRRPLPLPGTPLALRSASPGLQQHRQRQRFGRMVRVMARFGIGDGNPMTGTFLVPASFTRMLQTSDLCTAEISTPELATSRRACEKSATCHSKVLHSNEAVGWAVHFL